MKYIPTEKLITEIKGLQCEQGFEDGIEERGYQFAIKDILEFITSLQQEQPEPSNLVDVDAVREDFIAEVYRVLDADSTNDRANAIIDAFDSFPTVSQIQPEVDLEKEIKRFLSNATKMNKGEWRGKYPISDIGFRAVARHFWNKGYNARKGE